MTLRKTPAVAALTAATPQAVGSVSLGAPYARVIGFQAANWASSAKAAEGTDAAQRVKLVDAEDRVIFLDAADVDYGATSGPTPSTGGTYVFFGQDDTTAGLTDRAKDATGTALAADAGPIRGAVAKSPVAVSVINGGTVTDYFEVSLYVEV